MALNSINLYHSYLKSIEPLNDAERGRLFTALLEYSITGAEPELRGNERILFPTMKEQIDRDKAKYEAKCAKNRESSARGGAVVAEKWSAREGQTGAERPPNGPRTAPERGPNGHQGQGQGQGQGQNNISLSQPDGGDGEAGKKPKLLPTLDHGSDAYKAARYLDRRIRERLPTKPEAGEATLQSWARDIDKLNRIDGQNWDDIADVLEYSQNDAFWAPNIMSGAKFRRQFFTLLGRMRE